MNTTTEKLRGLVETIYLQTLNQRLPWSLSVDNARVHTVVGGFRVEIGVEPSDTSFESDIRFRIYDSDGNEVDTFTDQTLSAFSPVNVRMRSYLSVMTNTLELARRQASGAEQALDAVLAALGGKSVSDKSNTQITSFADDLDDDVPF